MSEPTERKWVRCAGGCGLGVHFEGESGPAYCLDCHTTTSVVADGVWLDIVLVVAEWSRPCRHDHDLIPVTLVAGLN